VDVENIMRRLRQNRDEGGLRSAESVILAASGEMRGTLFFAALITLLAALPIFFIDGMYGEIFRPLIVSYTLAVLAAMVVALTVTPALSIVLLSGKRLNVRESSLVSRLQNSYERTLARTMNSTSLANIAVIGLIIAGIVVMPFLKRDQMLPSFR